MNETCTDCGERATCEYDWGLGLRRGCAAHDPLRWPYGATMARLPSYYRTLAFPIAATAAIPVWPPQNIGAAPGCICWKGSTTGRCPAHSFTVATC